MFKTMFTVLAPLIWVVGRVRVAVTLIVRLPMIIVVVLVMSAVVAVVLLVGCSITSNDIGDIIIRSSIRW